MLSLILRCRKQQLRSGLLSFSHFIFSINILETRFDLRTSIYRLFQKNCVIPQSSASPSNFCKGSLELAKQYKCTVNSYYLADFQTTNSSPIQARDWCPNIKTIRMKKFIGPTFTFNRINFLLP